MKIKNIIKDLNDCEDHLAKLEASLIILTENERIAQIVFIQEKMEPFQGYFGLSTKHTLHIPEFGLLNSQQRSELKTRIENLYVNFREFQKRIGKLLHVHNELTFAEDQKKILLQEYF